MMPLIHKVMAPLRRQVGAMVNRARVQLVNDRSKTQSLQVVVLDDETREDVEHFQPAGFKSVPLANAEAVVLAVGGDGDHRIAVVVHDSKTRPTGWEPGETGIYNLTTGDLIRIKADGSIEITATSAIKIKAPLVEIDGDLKVNGEVSDAIGSMNQIRAAHNIHAHPPEASAPPSVLMV